jgi:hypothetical protein
MKNIYIYAIIAFLILWIVVPRLPENTITKMVRRNLAPLFWNDKVNQDGTRKYTVSGLLIAAMLGLFALSLVFAARSALNLCATDFAQSAYSLLSSWIRLATH